MEIQNTKDYEKFVTVMGNRNIVPNKVERIVKDVENGLNLFKYCPIIVSKEGDKFKIIDGQHRFTASKELKLPIHYVVADDIKLRDIARMNTNTDKWTSKDFLNCYIELGNKHYVELKHFMKKYSVTNYNMAVGLLMRFSVDNGGGKKSCMDVFRDGEFECKHTAKAINLIELVDSLFGNFVFYRDKKLIQAVKDIDKAGKWDLETMKKKMKDHRTMMDKQSTTKNYKLLIEQIYNMRMQKRRSIF